MGIEPIYDFPPPRRIITPELQDLLAEEGSPIIGSDETGRKELLALSDGYRESEASWTEVLMDLKQRGLKDAPNLAVGDGA